MVTASYYTSSPGKLSDGTKYTNATYFAATARRRDLGKKKRLYCPSSGRYVVVTIRDYVPGLGRNHIDLNRYAFRHLVGPRYRIIGIVKVKIL